MDWSYDSVLCNQIRSQQILCELRVGNISNYTVLISFLERICFVIKNCMFSNKLDQSYRVRVISIVPRIHTRLIEQFKDRNNFMMYCNNKPVCFSAAMNFVFPWLTWVSCFACRRCVFPYRTAKRSLGLNNLSWFCLVASGSSLGTQSWLSCKTNHLTFYDGQQCWVKNWLYMD